MRTPTPETKAAMERYPFLDSPWAAFCELSELATKLERERDEAMKSYSIVKENSHKYAAKLDQCAKILAVTKSMVENNFLIWHQNGGNVAMLGEIIELTGDKP